MSNDSNVYRVSSAGNSGWATLFARSSVVCDKGTGVCDATGQTHSGPSAFLLDSGEIRFGLKGDPTEATLYTTDSYRVVPSFKDWITLVFEHDHMARTLTISGPDAQGATAPYNSFSYAVATGPDAVTSCAEVETTMYGHFVPPYAQGCDLSCTITLRTVGS